MKSLKTMVEDPKIYEAVMADSLGVLDQEVAKRSGLAGMAMKGGYKLIKGIQQGKLLKMILAVLIPDFIERLDPYYSRFQKEGKGTSWTDFLRPDFDAIADEFLKVTDSKAKESTNRTIRSTYEKLRPKAKKEVNASLPALTKMMEKYL